MTTQTIAGGGTLAPAAPAPQRRRHDDRTAWAFLLPFLVLYVLFVIGPTVYALHPQPVQRQPGEARPRQLGGVGELRRGAEQLRLLVLALAHHLLHDPHDTAAGDPRVPLRAARGPGRARALVLPGRLLPPLRAAVRRDLADLDLDLHAGPRAAAGLAVRDRDHRADWLGDPTWAMPSRGDRHRLVDARVQLRPVPRRPAGHSARALRGGVDRRRRAVCSRSAASRSRCWAGRRPWSSSSR